MFQSLVERARGEALEVGALAAGDIDDLDIFAGANHIGFGRRLVDADVLKGIGQRLGQERLVRWANAARAGCKARIGVAVSCAPTSIAPPGAATIRSPSRETVNSPDGSRSRVAAEQGDGAGFGQIDAAPFEPEAHGTRALTLSAQDSLETACIARRRARRGWKDRWRQRHQPPPARKPACLRHRQRAHGRRAWIGTATAPPPGTV